MTRCIKLISLTKKNQNFWFSLEQLLDSGMIFLFIAVGGVVLSYEEMEVVVLSQSLALASVLFCSCFTTQYLLVKYKGQSGYYWFRILFTFSILIAFVSCFLTGSPFVVLLFISSIASEFSKRYCFYTERSFLSLLSTLLNLAIFSLLLLFFYYDGYLSSSTYIMLFCFSKIIPLCFVWLYFFIKRERKVTKDDGFFFGIKESIKYGSFFSMMTMSYWMTNQGFMVFSSGDISPQDLVEMRMTQNIFGIVTMLVVLYDTIFLKKNISNHERIFHIKGYLKFSIFSLSIIVFNLFVLYLLSMSFYKDIDVVKYAFPFAISQLFYLLVREPILILKLKYNLSILLWIYTFSLFFSYGYFFLFKGSEFPIYVVESIIIANFLVLLISLLMVIFKENRCGKVN